MKNIFNLILVLFASVFILSCRNSDDIPEDIHEHEEIEKVVLTLTEQGTANVQTINYVGGTADSNVNLVNGKVYDVSLDFQHKHGDHYESMLSEIEEEKNEHFITYDFAGILVNVVRTSGDIVRTDGKKLGLKTQWTVTSAGVNAKVNVKLFHGSTAVNDQFPSAANQLGTVTGGEADVNAMFSVQ